MKKIRSRSVELDIGELQSWSKVCGTFVEILTVFTIIPAATINFALRKVQTFVFLVVTMRFSDTYSCIRNYTNAYEL